mmetsp:Transcript_26562/g.39551  ORF Transcript_26562/g.39551 Transcript_26562/m.39551 type:complete len:250 (+) Transcript_26562:1-750(+)
MGTPSPQVAFAGRSNVGKSTLLNQLIHGHPDPMHRKITSERKKLDKPKVAPVSDRPGRTRHLFRFEVGGKLTFVDLPGYGFAKAPRQVKEGWISLVDEYLARAMQLKRVISLVDASVGVKESDEQLWEMLMEREHTMMVVLTKVDKVSPDTLNRNMAHVVSMLQRFDTKFVWPYVHAVSGMHGHGVEELRSSLSVVAWDASEGKALKGRRRATPGAANPQEQVPPVRSPPARGSVVPRTFGSRPKSPLD